MAKGHESNFRPLCVAVLDEGGHLKVLKREDGASILRPQIAISKAWEAIGMGESSRHLGERLSFDRLTSAEKRAKEIYGYSNRRT